MRPYRYYRQRRNTVMVRAPNRCLDQVLWPEFSELDQALQAYLHQVTLRVIREEVYADASDASFATHGCGLAQHIARLETVGNGVAAISVTTRGDVGPDSDQRIVLAITADRAPAPHNAGAARGRRLPRRPSTSPPPC